MILKVTSKSKKLRFFCKRCLQCLAYIQIQAVFKEYNLSKYKIYKRIKSIYYNSVGKINLKKHNNTRKKDKWLCT